MFLTQETELMRFRLLEGTRAETEQMIARYPEHLPLKKVVIPTVAELKERERKGQVVSEEEKLLSKELERVYPIITIKQEGHNVKDDKSSDKNPEESDGSSYQR